MNRHREREEKGREYFVHVVILGQLNFKTVQVAPLAKYSCLATDVY